MTAILILDNAEVFDVASFKILLGQKFAVELVDAVGPVNWFSDNDPVLNIELDAEKLKATMLAAKVGSSVIQLQDTTGSVIKRLNIEVYDRVAVALNASAKEPVQKK